jgi:hypothetical protein
MKSRLSRAALIVLAMVVYVSASRVLGEQYPFGPLSMFSGGLRVSSRIVARTSDGRLCELASFEGWHCEGRLDFRSSENPQCRTQAEHAESDRKAEALLRAGASERGQGAEVVVIRRIFSVAGTGGPAEVEDCPLAACTAREVPGTCASTP